MWLTRLPTSSCRRKSSIRRGRPTRRLPPQSGSVLIDKAHALLSWLAKQPPSTFWIFQAALRDYLPKDVADALLLEDAHVRELIEGAAKLSLAENVALMYCHGDAVTKTRRALQNYYRNLDRRQLVTRGRRSKGQRFSLQSLFINISVLKSETLERMVNRGDCFASSNNAERSQFMFDYALTAAVSLMALDEVFLATAGEEEEDAERLLAVGGAGSGKTVVFTQKAPLGWAEEKLWQQFALFFLVFLRDREVWDAATVKEVLKLKSLPGLTEADQVEVEEFIMNRPEHVLVVCDGFG